MSRVELPKPVLETLANALKRHLSSELHVDVGQFEALELVDWIAEHIGPRFYNQGLQDAQELYRKKFEEMADAVIEIEKPVKL